VERGSKVKRSRGPVHGMTTETISRGRYDDSRSHFVPRGVRSSGFDAAVVLPFANLGIPLFSQASGGANFNWGAPSSTAFGMPLDPNSTLSGYYPFGLEIGQISKNFRRWRIRNLSVTWEPAVPTSESGSFIIGYTPDGASTLTVEPGAGAIDSWQGSKLIPAGQRVPLTFPLNRDLLYVWDAAAITTESQRQTDAGVIFVRHLNAASAVNLCVGYLQMAGQIEFYEMGTQTTLDTLSRPLGPGGVPPLNSSSSSSTNSSTVAVTQPAVGSPAPRYVVDGQWVIPDRPRLA